MMGFYIGSNQVISNTRELDQIASSSWEAKNAINDGRILDQVSFTGFSSYEITGLGSGSRDNYIAYDFLLEGMIASSTTELAMVIGTPTYLTANYKINGVSSSYAKITNGIVLSTDANSGWGGVVRWHNFHSTNKYCTWTSIGSGRSSTTQGVYSFSGGEQSFSTSNITAAKLYAISGTLSGRVTVIGYRENV